MTMIAVADLVVCPDPLERSLAEILLQTTTHAVITIMGRSMRLYNTECQSR